MVQVIRVRIAKQNSNGQFLEGDLFPSQGTDVMQARNQLQSLANEAIRYRSVSMNVAIEEVPAPPSQEELALIAGLRNNNFMPTPDDIVSLMALRDGTVKLVAAPKKKEPKKKAAEVQGELVNETPAVEKKTPKKRAPKKVAAK